MGSQGRRRDDKSMSRRDAIANTNFEGNYRSLANLIDSDVISYNSINNAF